MVSQDFGVKERLPTHLLHHFGVGKIVDDDFAHLGKVPTVPFLLSISLRCPWIFAFHSMLRQEREQKCEAK